MIKVTKEQIKEETRLAVLLALDNEIHNIKEYGHDFDIYVPHDIDVNDKDLLDNRVIKELQKFKEKLARRWGYMDN